MKIRYLLYIITVAVLVFTIVWELKVQEWIAERPEHAEPIMRVDLFVLVPLVLTLVAVSLFRLIKGKK